MTVLTKSNGCHLMTKVKHFVFVVCTLFFSTNTAVAAVTDWVPFTLHNGHIKIPITISGIETHALMDTGAQLNAINEAFIAKHELDYTRGGQIRVRGVFGEETKSMFNNVPVNIFGFDTDLDSLTPVSLGHHSTGLLIGAGFFSSFIVQLDYPNSRMRLLSKDTVNLREFENIRMESQQGSGEPLVQVSFGADSSPFWVLLDTGNNGGLLIDRSLANRLSLVDENTASSISSGVNATASVASLRVDEFVFGPYTLENVLVSFPEEGVNANLSDQYSFTGTRIKSRRQRGILGYDILKHFVVTLDYASGHAHIGLPE